MKLLSPLHFTQTASIIAFLASPVTQTWEAGQCQPQRNRTAREEARAANRYGSPSARERGQRDCQPNPPAGCDRKSATKPDFATFSRRRAISSDRRPRASTSGCLAKRP